MILVVEGLTDAAFFQELLLRFFVHGGKVDYGERLGRRNIPMAVRGTRANGSLIEVEFRNQEGKAAIPDVIKGLLDGDVVQLAVAQDIDHDSPDQVVQAMQKVVYSNLCVNPPDTRPPDRTIMVEDRTIQVIPMGLYADQTLADLGIAKHELEDYLIKLLLEDAALREHVPDLRSLLQHILPAIREHEGSFESSKELFQLVKPIVQHGFSDVGVVKKLIQDAEPDILRAVLSPLLPDVERAFGIGASAE